MLELLFFVFGLLIGSFLNVCIYRLPQNYSVITPSSNCMSCGTKLAFLDLVPVLSYWLLHGKCRYCNTAFSFRYTLVELLTASMFLWCLKIIGLGPELIKGLVCTAFLIVITFIDYDHQLILDKVLVWFAGTGVAIILLMNKFNLLLEYLGITDRFLILTIDVVDRLIAILIGGGLMLLIAVVSRGGMGGGDIKFVAVLGIWLGWKLTLLTLFLSFIFGGLGGMYALVLKRKSRKDYIPFGPFIALGAFLSMLYGDAIVYWYIQHFLQ